MDDWGGMYDFSNAYAPDSGGGFSSDFYGNGGYGFDVSAGNTGYEYSPSYDTYDYSSNYSGGDTYSNDFVAGNTGYDTYDYAPSYSSGWSSEDMGSQSYGNDIWGGGDTGSNMYNPSEEFSGNNFGDYSAPYQEGMLNYSPAYTYQSGMGSSETSRPSGLMDWLAHSGISKAGQGLIPGPGGAVLSTLGNAGYDSLTGRKDFGESLLWGLGKLVGNMAGGPLGGLAVSGLQYLAGDKSPVVPQYNRNQQAEMTQQIANRGGALQDWYVNPNAPAWNPADYAQQQTQEAPTGFAQSAIQDITYGGSPAQSTVQGMSSAGGFAPLTTGYSGSPSAIQTISYAPQNQVASQQPSPMQTIADLFQQPKQPGRTSGYQKL